MTTGIMDETEAQWIPLPNDLPNKIDLSELPSSILRSGAVEALATQNEDLMARLSVTLRRTALLEEKIGQLEQANHQLQHRLSVTQDQILILQEKDRQVAQRHGHHEKDLRAKKEQLQLLEAQYAELYVTSKEKAREQQEDLAQLERQNRRYKQYRRRLKKALQHYRQQFSHLQLQLSREVDSCRDLKVKLGDAASHIQGLTKVHRDEQRQLVDNYEKELNENRSKAEKLSEDNRLLSSKLIEFDQLVESRIHLENRLIQEQRLGKEACESRDRELMELQASLQEYRLAHKSQTLSLEQKTSEALKLDQDLSSAQSEIKRLRDQVETLQLLWAEGQTLNEKKDSRIQALQNLNQQLSTTIQGQRHEILTLRQEMAAESASTSERIKELKGHLLVLEKRGLDFVDSNNHSPPTHQWLSRIDTLIAEIQSGFRRRNPDDQDDQIVSADQIVSDDQIVSGDSGSISAGDKRGIGETAKP